MQGQDGVGKNLLRVLAWRRSLGVSLLVALHKHSHNPD